MVNYGFLLLIQHFDKNFAKAIEIKEFNDKKNQGVILGNSLTLDGIDVEYLTNKGIDSYNFALGGSTLKSNYIQLMYYLKNNDKPDFILLGLGSSLKNYSSSKSAESVHPIINYCYNDLNLTIDNLPMIKFKWLATENLKKLVSKQHRETKIVLGQLKIKRKVLDNTKYKDKVKSQIFFDDYKGAKYLFKIDSVCKVNNIELITIEMPGYKKTQNDIPLGPNFIKYKNDSIRIYNMNNRDLCKKLFDDKNDWVGNSHLNEYGAKKLTKYIYENILED